MKPDSFDITDIQIQIRKLQAFSSFIYFLTPLSVWVASWVREAGYAQIQGPLLKKGLPLLNDWLSLVSDLADGWLDASIVGKSAKDCTRKNLKQNDSKRNAWFATFCNQSWNSLTRTYLTWCFYKCGQCWSTMSRFWLELMIVCK